VPSAQPSSSPSAQFSRVPSTRALVGAQRTAEQQPVCEMWPFHFLCGLCLFIALEVFVCSSSSAPSSASSASSTSSVPTKFYPIAKEAYWIGGDTLVARRQHFEGLMHRLGYEHLNRTSFESVQATEPRTGLAVGPTPRTLSRAHQQIIQHISEIPPPQTYFSVFEDDVMLAKNVNYNSKWVVTSL
jgi:hypothetical protein